MSYHIIRLVYVASFVRRIFQLIHITGPRKPTVSETIRDQQGVLISNKEKRLDRWAEHFEEQFNLPHASVQSDAQPTTESLTVNLNPSSI